MAYVYSRRRRNCPICGRSVTWAWNIGIDQSPVWACNDCHPGGGNPERADWPTKQAAQVPQKETPIMATTTKTCPGVKDGSTVIITAHDAPATNEYFCSNAARKDGLGRVCKTCWARYTQVLKSRKASGTPATPKADKPAKAPRVSPLRDEAPTISDHDLVATYGEAAGWTTEVLGATRYAIPVTVAAVATDDGQEALAIVARAKDAQRKRDARAAAKAAATA